MLRRRRRGYLIIFVLSVVVICLFLLLGLTIWSEQARILSSRSRIRSTNARLTEGLNRKLVEALGQDPTSTPSDSSYQLPGSQLTVAANWNGDSISRPVDTTISDGKTLFKDKSQDVSFNDSTDKGTAQLPVPQWNHLARATLPNGLQQISLVSTAYPYAAYAPWGTVEIQGKVISFNNPLTPEDSSQPVVENAIPLKLYGYDGVTVTGAVAQGTVETLEGKLDLGQGSLAVGYQNRPTDPRPLQKVIQDLVGGGGVFDLISAGTLDKTRLISEEFFTVEGVWDLFTGKAGLSMFFSMRQACGIPLPLFPASQNYEAWDIILFHHPYPVDFQGHSKSLSDLKSAVGDLKKAYQDAKKAVSEAWKGVVKAGAGLWDDIKGAFDWVTGKKKKAKKEFEKAKKKYNEAKKDFENAWSDLKNFFGDFAKMLQDLGEGLEPDPPVTAEEEEDYITTGWCYIGIIGHLTEDLGDFFTAIFSSNKKNWNNLIADLTNFTRVVHFVDRNPWGGFRSDGGFQLGMTWTVPRGRTLKWSRTTGAGDFEVVGDLWLQKGSTLYVDGNLYVITPPPKSQYDDDKKDPWGYNGGSDVRPTGTIFLEEGASLLVTGDLYAGGSKARGSVQMTSSLGVTPALTSMILCKGDVRLPHGTRSGLTFPQLLEGLSKYSPIFKGINEDLVKPLINDIAPHLSKVWGPFVKRECWFAKYATTLVLIPELAEFGLQGPWPIPLPYSNCMVKVFEPLSKLYSIELNFVLGENLFTAAPWWPFETGVVPIVGKTNAKTYLNLLEAKLEAVVGIKINAQEIMGQLGNFMEEVIPEIAESILKDTIVFLVEAMLEDVAGDFEDPCAEKNPEKDDESEENKDEIDEKLKDYLGTLKDDVEGPFKDALKGMLQANADDFEAGILGQESKLTEQAGVLLYAGGQLTVGRSVNEPTALASGFFLAEGDVLLYSDITIGAAASRTGNVSLSGDLLYYPYFTRAFPYIPMKPDDYWVNTSKMPGFFHDFVEVFKNSIYLETPKKGTGKTVGTPQARVVVQGYVE